MEQLKEAGYTVISQVYSKEECNRLATSITGEVIDIVFRDRNIKFKDLQDLSTDNFKNLELLTDIRLREEKMEHPEDIWRDCNSRNPIISKNCGIIDIHYNLDVLKLITTDKRLYELMAELYQSKELVHLDGPERVSVKSKGSVDMPQHIDSNLFYSEVNYPSRIQCLVCVSIDPQVQSNPEDSGTLSVLQNFHHYWDLAAELFHPKTGLFPFPDSKSRYFLLPKNFDKQYLPKLREHIRGYTDYLFRKVIPEDNKVLSFYQGISSKVKVPEKIKEIKWTAVICSPGDVICWDQKLPHRNVRNKFDIPRIVCYYSVFPVSKDRDVESVERCGRMFSKNIFLEGNTLKNVEECKYIEKRDLKEKIQRIISKTKISRRLCGYSSWFK